MIHEAAPITITPTSRGTMWRGNREGAAGIYAAAKTFIGKEKPGGKQRLESNRWGGVQALFS